MTKGKNNAAQASTALERNIYIIMAPDCIFIMDSGTCTLSFYFLLILQVFFFGEGPEVLCNS